MKKTIRIIVIIGAILLLCKLFVVPLPNPWSASGSLKEARRSGGLVNEYRIISIDTLQSGYNFPINSVWTQKYVRQGRNKFGIVVTQVHTSKYTMVRLSLIERDTFFTKDNMSAKWRISDEEKSGFGITSGYIAMDFPYSSVDTVAYFIFKVKDEEASKFNNRFSTENLIPLFRFKVVAIEKDAEK